MVEQEQQHRAPAAAAPASRFQRKREGEKTRARGRNEQTVHGRRLLCGPMCLSSMHGTTARRTNGKREDGRWMDDDGVSLSLSRSRSSGKENFDSCSIFVSTYNGQTVALNVESASSPW